MDGATWRAMVAVGFLIGQAILIYIFHETQRTTRQIEMIRLARDLSNEFYSGQILYRDIRNAIESCAPLYKSWGGRFSHDEINRYLGFFEDIGYFYKSGSLSKGIVAHLYGAYMIEAFEYPEVKKYIALVRKNASQAQAFEQLELLVRELEREPEFAELTKTVAGMCSDTATSKDGSG